MVTVVRDMCLDEVAAVADLVGRVFDEHVAPLYDPAGAAEFRRYAAPGFITRRLKANHHVLVAEDDEGCPAGAAEIREYRHLSMFFVETRAQRRGVGRALLSAAVEHCRRHRPALVELTVHASPNAVAAYERWGFVAQGPEYVRDGIRFTPMSLAFSVLDIT